MLLSDPLDPKEVELLHHDFHQLEKAHDELQERHAKLLRQMKQNAKDSFEVIKDTRTRTERIRQMTQELLEMVGGA